MTAYAGDWVLDTNGRVPCADQCGVESRLRFRDGRTRLAEDNAPFADANPSLRVSRHRQFQRLDEITAEIPQAAIALAELAVEGGPAYLNVSAQCVQAISKPDVNVDHHAPRPNCPQRRFTYGDRVFTQRPVEFLVK